VTKLVYVGGYGRSGSTLLEYLLAASPELIACGEVAAFRHVRAGQGCSCGRRIEDCPIWGELFRPPAALEGWSHKQLTLALLDRVSDRYGILVDSSKTAWDSVGIPFAFRKAVGKDFKLIHLVRDPRGVCWSNVSGKRRRRGQPLPDIERSPVRFVRHLRTVLGWWSANLVCELFGLLFPSQYARVCYEELAESPESALGKIFQSLDLGPGPKLGAVNANDNRHQLSGSRVRYQAVDPSEMRQDVRWKTQMPSADRRMISILTWPMRLRYGY
jgi:sulfotransferase family protein